MAYATLAGGCFWCMVKPFTSYPGIESVVSGYSGGHVENPTYEQVCTNQTGHVEAVQITYNPEITSFENILDVYFKTFDPTDDGGQFFDRGESYQPVIFYHDEEQRKAAILKNNKLMNKVYLRNLLLHQLNHIKISILQKIIIKITIKRILCIMNNTNVDQAEKHL